MMVKLICLLMLSDTIYANDLENHRIVTKLKEQICSCEKNNLKREIDFEMFHEPYLRDSLILFASENFTNVNRLVSFAKIKIIYRIRF